MGRGKIEIENDEVTIKYGRGHVETYKTDEITYWRTSKYGYPAFKLTLVAKVVHKLKEAKERNEAAASLARNEANVQKPKPQGAVAGDANLRKKVQRRGQRPRGKGSE